ncbi:hypothetical protein HaLaN_20112 [Haematococcus lacustris]|uniref:Uncharacterized protein n=1 Tax=Haematococcus lacustris TaxID=44745 RepID=A0A699ZWI3_HAELA|nr:hypothetical protein HaLaN_20112 [Haematococcus lacustris]
MLSSQGRHQGDQLTSCSSAAHLSAQGLLHPAGRHWALCVASPWHFTAACILPASPGALPDPLHLHELVSHSEPRTPGLPPTPH